MPHNDKEDEQRLFIRLLERAGVHYLMLEPLRGTAVYCVEMACSGEVSDWPSHTTVGYQRCLADLTPGQRADGREKLDYLYLDIDDVDLRALQTDLAREGGLGGKEYIKKREGTLLGGVFAPALLRPRAPRLDLCLTHTFSTPTRTHSLSGLQPTWCTCALGPRWRPLSCWTRRAAAWTPPPSRPSWQPRPWRSCSWRAHTHAPPPPPFLSLSQVSPVAACALRMTLTSLAQALSAAKACPAPVLLL